MLKLAGVAGSILVVLVVAFIVIPKALLHVSGNDQKHTDQNVPVGESRAEGSPSASGVHAARRFEDFASITSGAKFTPLTPSSLPQGYQAYEQYLRTANGPEVVLTYMKAPSYYILIDERRASAAQLTSSFVPSFSPVAGASRPTFRNPVVDVGGIPAFYFTGRYGPAARAFGRSSDLPYHNSEGHSLEFFKSDLQILVEADLNDVTRDQLVQIAAGLR